MLWRPCSPLLGFHSIIHYSIHFNIWMVSHPSTYHGPSCLTAVISRELLFPTWYSRSFLKVTWTATVTYIILCKKITVTQEVLFLNFTKKNCMSVHVIFFCPILASFSSAFFNTLLFPASRRVRSPRPRFNLQYLAMQIFESEMLQLQRAKSVRYSTHHAYWATLIFSLFTVYNGLPKAGWFTKKYI